MTIYVNASTKLIGEVFFRISSNLKYSFDSDLAETRERDHTLH